MIPKPVVYFLYIWRGGKRECVFGNRRLFKNWYLFEGSSVLLLMGKWAINISFVKSALEESTLL